MADPITCNVSGILRYPTGIPVVYNEIEIFLAASNALPQFSQGSLITGKSVLLETDEDGYFETPLMRGSLVTIHVKRSNFQCQFMVPDVESVDIKDIPGVDGILREVENPF